MIWWDIANYAVNGALVGLLYALVAMGFVVIYRASRVLNLAQGELFVFGAFIVWTLVLAIDLPIYVGVPLALVLSVGVGWAIERLFFSRLAGESIFAMVMVTIGLLILLRGLILLLWGPESRAFPVIFPLRPLIIGELFIPLSLVYGGALTCVLAFAFAYFFDRTRTGLNMTAVAEDHLVAMSLGISVKWSIAMAWMIGAALSTTGAVIFLSGKSLSFLASDVGFNALPVALLAGLESVRGLLIAGAIVGVSQSLASLLLDPVVGGSISTVVPYILMLAILFIRPSGLFGWSRIERV